MMTGTGGAETGASGTSGMTGTAGVMTGTSAKTGTGETVGARRIPRVRGFAERAGERRGERSDAGPGEGEAPRRRAGLCGCGFRARRTRASRPRPTRPDAVGAVEESNLGRIPELTPIRVGRMAATPFAFLRGSAGSWRTTWPGTPMTGIRAQICGDAHAANFGLYGDARGGLVIDLNDFDETVFGPWEWDLKRLATSLVLAGRVAGADEDTCRAAAHGRGGRLPPHHAAARQAAGAGRVERHRRRGAGLPHRRP